MLDIFQHLLSFIILMLVTAACHKVARFTQQQYKQ